MNVIGSLRSARRRLNRGSHIEGVFDGFTGAAFTGWCMAVNGAPAQVRLLFGPHLIAVTAANIVRADLEALSANGRLFGFSFPVSDVEAALADVTDIQLHSFRVISSYGQLRGTTPPVTARSFSDMAAVVTAVSVHGAAITLEAANANEIY